MNLNPLNWFRNSTNHAPRQGPHMTFATSSVGRSVSRTGVFLRKQIWVWPIIAVVLLSVIGFIVRHQIETTMREGLESQLQTLVDLEKAMLNTWYKSQQSNAQSLANNIDVRQTVYPLLDAASTQPAGAKDQVATLRAKLDKSLGPALTAHQYSGYIVADKKKRIVAAGRTELIGQQDIPEYSEFLTRALDGTTAVSAPFASVVAL